VSKTNYIISRTVFELLSIIGQTLFCLRQGGGHLSLSRRFGMNT